MINRLSEPAFLSDKICSRHSKTHRTMKEIILLMLVAISSIFILGYSLHMLIGGLVSAETEQWIITTACVIGTIIVAFMGWDIVQQRRMR